MRADAKVNLRSGPGTNFSILGTVPLGGTGMVTGYPTAAGATPGIRCRCTVSRRGISPASS